MKQPGSMPDREKFLHAFGMVRLYQKYIPAFVEERLGYAAKHELNSVWQAAIAPIREDDSDHEKYESAYSNWLWMARCSHDFLADQLDSNGVADYKRLLLQLYTRHYDSSELSIHRMLGNQAALAKAWAYHMQWMTPVEVTDKSNQQVSCVVQDCKILQTPATIRICRVDCRNVGTVLAKQVYHLKRVTVAADHSCTITLTPLRD